MANEQRREVHSKPPCRVKRYRINVTECSAAQNRPLPKKPTSYGRTAISGRIPLVPVPWKPIALGGLVLGIVTAIVRANHKHVEAPKRVALIGDSYAVGLGPELTKLLPDFKYSGIVGAGTGAYGTLPSWVAPFKPDVVLVSLGVNDGSTPNVANYQAIVREIHGIGATVMWIYPPAAVNTPAVRSVIASLGVATVPATNVALSADGLHPNSYGSWAQQVATALS